MRYNYTSINETVIETATQIYHRSFQQAAETVEVCGDKGTGQSDDWRQEETGIDRGHVFLPTIAEVKGEVCKQKCPAE